MKTNAHETGASNRVRPLWQWIGVRMIGLALAAMLLVGMGMWLRFFWWEGQLRSALPDSVQMELQALEVDPAGNADRLRQIYGQYLYGDYFAPEVLHADLWWFSGLLLIALPMVIAGGDFSSRAEIVPARPPPCRG